MKIKVSALSAPANPAAAGVLAALGAALTSTGAMAVGTSLRERLGT